MLELDSICRFPEGIAVSPRAPFPVIEIGIIVPSLGVVIIGVNEERQLIDSVGKVTDRGRRRSDQLVHQASHPAQIHLVEGRIVIDEILETVRRSSPQIVVCKVIIKVCWPANPVAPKAEIDIPHQWPPFPGPKGIPVEVVILVAMIPVVGEVQGREVVDGSWNIDIVVAVLQPRFSRQAESGYEVLKVTIIFILPGFLVNATGGGIEPVVHLVEGTFGVESHAV